MCLKELWIGSLTKTNFQNKSFQTTKFTNKSTKSTKITTRHLQILSLHEVFVLLFCIPVIIIIILQITSWITNNSKQMLMFLQPLETERKSNLLQKFMEHMSDNTATRSVTLIIINDESDNFSLGSHQAV